MSEITKIIESVKKIDEDIKKLYIERYQLIKKLQEELNKILEEQSEAEMTIKCLEQIITKAPEYREIICAIKSEYGIERIEEYIKDSKTIKLIKIYKVLTPDILDEEMLNFVADEFNKHIIVVQ